MRFLPLIAALAACASCARPLTSEASLAQEATGRAAGPMQSCVSTDLTQNLRVLDTRTVAYRSGRTIYVNRLAAPCPGLQPTSTLIIEAQGAQYCRGDRIRAREPGAVVSGPVCVLGDWVPYRQVGRETSSSTQTGA
jgi:hypothetical protein